MDPVFFTAPGLASFARSLDIEVRSTLTTYGEPSFPDGTDSARAGFAEELYQDGQIAHRDGVLTWAQQLEMMTAVVVAAVDPAVLRALLVRIVSLCAMWERDLQCRPHPMVCAHCGEPIETDESRWTWVGPVPEPGVPACGVPRFHGDRPECRAASGRACDAAKAARTAVRTPDPAVRADQDGTQ
ncbi:hypothetical protein [Streptomyces sp. NPDC048659]|uniref:hypothetical protein n=1 Tax=Streptomyces sp. NPDC048659 TaxID=3155489 RepID=UPI0034223B95